VMRLPRLDIDGLDWQSSLSDSSKNAEKLTAYRRSRRCEASPSPKFGIGGLGIGLVKTSRYTSSILWSCVLSTVEDIESISVVGKESVVSILLETA
jgi:hypothetical protein